MATRTANLTSYSAPINPQIRAMVQQTKTQPTGNEKPGQIIGDPIFFREDLAECRLKFNFLEASYKGGPEYKDAKDCKGQPVLIEHENERTDLTLTGASVPNASDQVNKSEATLKSEKYGRRKRTASYINYVRPIVDKIRAYVLQTVPVRPEDDKEISKEIARIELDKKIDRFLLDGLIFTEAWIGFDTKSFTPQTGRKTVTQAEIDKADPKHRGKPYIVNIDPRCVVDYDIDEDTGEVTRVVIEEVVRSKASIMSQTSLSVFYREWTKTSWTLYRLVPNTSGDIRVVRDNGGSHSFGRCPFFRGVIPFPIKDICELNRHHFNVGSVLDEEEYANTFSQRYITGMSPADVAVTDRGAGNTMVLPSEFAKVGIISGDPQQSVALMTRLEDIKIAIFDIVSMNHPEKSVSESAEKKKRDLEALYTLLSKIADVVETVENDLLLAMEIYKPEDDTKRSHYNKQFDVFSVGELIGQVNEVSKAPFVAPTLKRRLTLALAQKVDPFGPHGTYKSEVDGMFDTSSTIIESLMGMKREGAMTTEMLVTALSIPKTFVSSLEDAIDMHTQANLIGPGLGGSSDGTDIPIDSRNTPTSDGNTNPAGGAPAIPAKPRRGKAGGV